MRCSTTVGVGLLWLALGGIFPPAHAAPPNPETRTKESPALPSPAGASRVEMASLPVTEGELTLAQVLDLAERGNAQLAAAADEISAREAAARQAGFLPNPELSVEVANFAGQNDLQGVDAAETTLAFGQLLELGGKRGGRRQIADLGRDLAEWDLRGQRLEVLAGTAKSFVEVLAGQDRVRQAEELESLAARVLAAVAARVEAGKVPPIEATRARVERAAAATVLFKARRELASSRLRLSAFWGETNPRFTRVIGDLSAIPEIPAESVIASRVENNPGVARWGSEFAQLQVALTLARAQAIPDVTVSLGVRHFQETGDNALIAGLSLPIPLFDRNQGGVGAAQATLAKARHQRQAAVTEVQAALGTAWHQLVAAQAEAKTLRDEIVPGAESAFEAARFGYEEGKFDFLTMLDAQRTLFEVRGQYLQVLLTLHQTRIEVERLIGFPLHDLHARAQSSHPNEVTP